jgi:hypothetical protein
MLSSFPQSASDGTTVDALVLNNLERYLPQDLLYEDIIHKSQFAEDSKWPSRPTSAGSLTPSTEEPLSPRQFSSQDSFPNEQDTLIPSATELPLPARSCIQSSSWYIQPREEQVQVHGETVKALRNLTDLVLEGNLRREDLMVHEITAQVYPFIPYDHEGKVTSLGSILHAESACNPCAFFQKDRCHKKDLCLYCHFKHDISKPPSTRKSKQKRMIARNKIEKCERWLDQQEQCDATSKLYSL